MSHFLNRNYSGFGRKFNFTYLQLIVSLALVSFAGILQNTDILNIAGVKPNVALGVLISLSFIISEVLHFLVLLVVAAGILGFQPGSSAATLVFGALVLFVFFAHDRLPGRAFINNILLIGFTTIFFYIIVDFPFLRSNFLSVAYEVIYNVILGTVFLFSFKKIFKKI